MADTAGLTEHCQANDIKIGGYCIIKEHPCKVVETAWSKPGKHGAGKIRMVGIDIFNGQKIENSTPSTAGVERPIVTRNDFQLLDVEDGFCSLVNDAGKDLNIKLPEYPEGIAAQIQAAFAAGDEVDVVVLSAMGKEAITSFKVNK
ncbi:MAG: translation initiation factor IF-5A [archaeon]|nr:translation initiation factor IF-5A [archaeon]